MNKRLHLSKILMYSFLGLVTQCVLSTSLLAATLTSSGQKTVSVKDAIVDIKFENEELPSVLSKIEERSGYTFVYFEKDISKAKTFTGSYTNHSLYHVLLDISKETALSFKQVNNNISVRKDHSQQGSVEVVEGGILSGRVTDAEGRELMGATVLIDGTNGTITDVDGRYSIALEGGLHDVQVSYIGFMTHKETFSIGKEDVTLNFTLEADLLGLDEVVVTGTTNPKTKLESSVALTTISSGMMESIAPRYTADLLQAIPGFQVETSGGEVGNNLFARGIPSAGAYEYVQIQEDGLPVFEDGALQFANIDVFQRVDLTVERVEAVRGGTASILASGAPGGIINFQSKTGQNEFGGEARLMVGDFGLRRTDLNIGGALVQDQLFFNLGGFYRVDEGIRSPGFDANKGGQIKANMTYLFPKGLARVYYKHLNDRNIFYQSTPFVKNGDDIEGYDGFDPNFGTFTSRNFSQLKVPQAGGGYFEANLEDGVHPVSNSIGALFEYDLGENVSIKNAMKSTQNDLNYNAIFAAQWMGDVSTQGEIAVNYGLDLNNALFTYDDSGETLESDTELKRADYWYINKQMRNFANNFSINIELDPLTLTFGHYYSNWTSDQNWNWSSFLVSASDDPRLVNLVDQTTDTAYTWNGISGITWLQRESQIKNTINAAYFNADYSLSSNLTANVGFRYERHDFSGVGDHGTWGNDIGALPTNYADNGVNILRGDFTYWEYDIEEFSYTAALNYQFDDAMALYGRISHGFRPPIEESFYGPAVESGAGTEGLNDLEPTFVDQAEMGFKYSSPSFALFVNGFFMRLSNIAYQDIQGTSGEGKFANVNNLGVETEAILSLGRFGTNFTITLQNPKYADYEGSQEALNGNLARRISKTFFTIRPNYSITDNLKLYVNYQYYGKKYQDFANTFELPAFGIVGSGVSYATTGYRISLDGTNLFNTIGLTEADGLQSGAAPVDGDTFMGRSILGRAIRLSASIYF